MIEKIKDKKGMVTIEASLILVMFMAFYIALLSFFDVYKTYTIVQNALNQSAKEIAQYAYIIKVMNLEDTGKETKKRAEAFKDETKDTINTIGVCLDTSQSGLLEAIKSSKEVSKDTIALGKGISSDINETGNRIGNPKYSELENISETLDKIEKRQKEIEELRKKTESSVEEIKRKSEEINVAYEDMSTKVSNYSEKYFKDPRSFIKEMQVLGKDMAFDGAKSVLIYPITLGLMNKYLSVYSDKDFINMGIVGGKSGINYWGSNMFVRDYDICLVASYKCRFSLPFLDKIELNVRNTALTRAWIGDKEK